MSMGHSTANFAAFNPKKHFETKTSSIFFSAEHFLQILFTKKLAQILSVWHFPFQKILKLHLNLLKFKQKSTNLKLHNQYCHT